MQVTIPPTGNSQDREPTQPARAGWAEAAQVIAAQDEDALVLGEFGNADGEVLAW